MVTSWVNRVTGMRHRIWKIVFVVSWIPALWLYGNLVSGLTSMGEEGTAGLAGGLAFFLLLIPAVLYMGVQVALGYLAFRR